MPVSIVPVIEKQVPDKMTVTWNLIDDSVGLPVEIGSLSDKCIQFTGVFAAAVVTLEGSNDGVTYVTLTDQNDNNISTTVNKIEMVAQNPRYIRPAASAAGDGTTAVQAVLFAKRP